jgi:hypothetical protein
MSRPACFNAESVYFGDILRIFRFSMQNTEDPREFLPQWEKWRVCDSVSNAMVYPHLKAKSAKVIPQ